MAFARRDGLLSEIQLRENGFAHATVDKRLHVCERGTEGMRNIPGKLPATGGLLE